MKPNEPFKNCIGKDVKHLFPVRSQEEKEERIRIIRRRVEDVLRKSNPDTILKVAHILGVKTT